LIGQIPWPKSDKKRRRGRPYVYPPSVILRCFIVRIWLRLDSNRALHDFLAMDYYPHNRRIMKACGLTSLPDRRTFDRRLSKISADIKERIATMTSLFVKEKLVDPYIIAESEVHYFIFFIHISQYFSIKEAPSTSNKAS
jgi:hypothetical protein